MTGQNEYQTVKDMCEIERQPERLGWETEKQNADVVLAETVKNCEQRYEGDTRR